MAEPNTTLKLRSCYKCGYQGNTADDHCPECQGKTQTSGSIRIRGVLLLLCGGFLVPFMGYIAFWMVNLLNNPSSTGGKFNGTREQLLMIFAIFGLVIVFGMIAFLTGLWQLIFGRRNKIFVWGVAGLGFLLFVVGSFFLWTNGK